MELSLQDFWPSPEHCDECLVTEAETADVAVFLAVHQPMRLVRRHLRAQTEPEEKTKPIYSRGYWRKTSPRARCSFRLLATPGSVSRT